MRKLKIAYLLAFAPILMGADVDEFASSLNGLSVTSALPECGNEEFLTYSSGGLICASLSSGGGGFGGPANCKAQGQILTYSMTGDVGGWNCINKGTDSLSSGDVTTINTKYQELVNMETQIRNLEMGMRTPAAKYCGQTAAVKGSITAVVNGTPGLAAAAKLCEGATGCGPGARMCSVYDMYNSVANGSLTTQTAVSKSWIYMAAWRGQAGSAYEPEAALADNCGSYTYDTGDRAWQGTSVTWSGTGATFVLRYFTGAQSPCSTPLPIACCR